ncbi:MAG: tail fiber protein [Proteobacteria bacterium]|nr:tail fiber protein [Pseudomonadota bacterium]
MPKTPDINTIINPVVDNTTLELSAQTIKVKDQGISGDKIQDNIISTNKLSSDVRDLILPGYVSNGSADADTSLWNVYRGAATDAAPSSGSGNSPTPTVTWTRTTTNPLRGQGSFLFTKTAIDSRGQGVAYDFTVEKADLGKVLSITFDYEVRSAVGTSGYETGDLIVYIIQNPTGTSVQIQPTGYQIVSGSIRMQHIATFQTDSSIQTYRLCIHVATQKTAIYSLAFDKVRIEPQKAVVAPGGFVGEIIAFGSKTSPPGFLYCDGSPVLISQYQDLYNVVGQSFGDGTKKADGTSSGYTSSQAFNLPNLCGVFLRGSDSRNITVGSTTLTYAGGNVGREQQDQTQGHKHNYTDPTIPMVAGSLIGVVYDGTGNTAEYVAGNAGTTTNPITDGTNGTPRTGTQTHPANVTVAYHIRFRSTFVMSSEADTRVVAFQSSLLNTVSCTGNSLGTPVKVNGITSTLDTHGQWSNANNRYTISVPGIYQINASVSTDVQVATKQLYITKNGTTVNLGEMTQAYAQLSPTAIVSCVAGDQIEFYLACSGVAANWTWRGASIQRISGPTAIAASEKIAARYKAVSTSTTCATGSFTNINFNTKDIDTHNAVTTGSGVWKFTAPAVGIYRVSALVTMTTADYNGSSGFYCTLYKTSSGVATQYCDGKRDFDQSTGIPWTPSSSLDTLVNLLAGESIDIRMFQGSGSNATTLNDTNG